MRVPASKADNLGGALEFVEGTAKTTAEEDAALLRHAIFFFAVGTWFFMRIKKGDNDHERYLS